MFVFWQTGARADTALMRYLRSGVALAMSGFGLKATVGFIEQARVGNHSTLIIWL
jgi:hypothetical protein